MGRKTILDIVKAANEELGFPSPDVVHSSPDLTVKQQRAWTSAACDELLVEHSWQQLLKVHTFTTSPGIALYDLPNDFVRAESDTLWNRSTSLPLSGSESSQTWQAITSGISVTGPFERFRVIGDQFELLPVPAEAANLAFEYYSADYVIDGTTGERKAGFTQDSDRTVFDDRVLINFLKLKFLQEKGLNTVSAATSFNASFINAVGRNRPATALFMGGRRSTNLLTNRNVPDGNWG